jgi:hypothetical protein
MASRTWLRWVWFCPFVSLCTDEALLVGYEGLTPQMTRERHLNSLFVLLFCTADTVDNERRSSSSPPQFFWVYSLGVCYASPICTLVCKRDGSACESQDVTYMRFLILACGQDVLTISPHWVPAFEIVTHSADCSGNNCSSNNGSGHRNG